MGMGREAGENGVGEGGRRQLGFVSLVSSNKKVREWHDMTFSKEADEVRMV
jgi:hypothetical protein